jgi:hypothetical protein
MNGNRAEYGVLIRANFIERQTEATVGDGRAQIDN